MTCYVCICAMYSSIIAYPEFQYGFDIVLSSIEIKSKGVQTRYRARGILQKAEYLIAAKLKVVACGFASGAAAAKLWEEMLKNPFFTSCALWLLSWWVAIIQRQMFHNPCLRGSIFWKEKESRTPSKDE